jgi:PAB1-binding protein PBP1
MVPPWTVLVCGMPAATIMNFTPFVNIPSFGMCSSITNPTVAAATTAALGVLTPMPCVPVTTPWIPSNPMIMTTVGPFLSENDVCMCTWGGQIKIVVPGQFTVI